MGVAAVLLFFGVGLHAADVGDVRSFADALCASCMLLACSEVWHVNHVLSGLRGRLTHRRFYWL